MSLLTRSILDQELMVINNDLLRLTSMVDTAIEDAMDALYHRDVQKAQGVVYADEEVNTLRYDIEEKGVCILATQQPKAVDLRATLAAIHLAVELERIGDHAAGIARLVGRLEQEDEIDALYKLPKMAKRARQILRAVIDAYIARDAEAAQAVTRIDDKIDRKYNKLFRETIREMRDESYIRRATYLLWVGHNLERIGDRAINIAERVIFMVTGEYAETADGRRQDDYDFE